MQKLLDGIYEVAYFGGQQPGAALETLLAVCRSGHLTGSDRHGGVFSGVLIPNPAPDEDALSLRVSYDIPEGGELVTGRIAGINGDTIKITGEIAFKHPASRATVTLDGEDVSIDIRYLGPLPR